jgi:hypothetical protein
MQGNAVKHLTIPATAPQFCEAATLITTNNVLNCICGVAVKHLTIPSPASL